MTDKLNPASNERLANEIERALNVLEPMCSSDFLFTAPNAAPGGELRISTLRNAIAALRRTSEPAQPTAGEAGPERWYLGAMNDGLFIINTPPRPSTDDQWHDRPNGPTLVLNIVALTHERAQAIVDAHNAALRRPADEQLREALKEALDIAERGPVFKPIQCPKGPHLDALTSGFTLNDGGNGMARCHACGHRWQTITMQPRIAELRKLLQPAQPSEAKEEATALLREVFDDRGCRIVNHDDSRVVKPVWVRRVTDYLCNRPPSAQPPSVQAGADKAIERLAFLRKNYGMHGEEMLDAFETVLDALQVDRLSPHSQAESAQPERGGADKCVYPEECKAYGHCIKPDDHDNPPPCNITPASQAQPTAGEAGDHRLWCEAIVATQDGTSGRMVCDVETLLHYVNTHRRPADEQLRRDAEVRVLPAIWDGSIRFDSDCVVNGVEIKAGTVWKTGQTLPAIARKDGK